MRPTWCRMSTPTLPDKHLKLSSACLSLCVSVCVCVSVFVCVCLHVCVCAFWCLVQQVDSLRCSILRIWPLLVSSSEHCWNIVWTLHFLGYQWVCGRCISRLACFEQIDEIAQFGPLLLPGSFQGFQKNMFGLRWTLNVALKLLGLYCLVLPVQVTEKDPQISTEAFEHRVVL